MNENTFTINGTSHRGESFCYQCEVLEENPAGAKLVRLVSEEPICGIRARSDLTLAKFPGTTIVDWLKSDIDDKRIIHFAIKDGKFSEYDTLEEHLGKFRDDLKKGVDADNRFRQRLEAKGIEQYNLIEGLAEGLESTDELGVYIGPRFSCRAYSNGSGPLHLGSPSSLFGLDPSIPRSFQKNWVRWSNIMPGTLIDFKRQEDPEIRDALKDLTSEENREILMGKLRTFQGQRDNYHTLDHDWALDESYEGFEEARQQALHDIENYHEIMQADQKTVQQCYDNILSLM